MRRLISITVPRGADDSILHAGTRREIGVILVAEGDTLDSLIFDEWFVAPEWQPGEPPLTAEERARVEGWLHSPEAEPDLAEALAEALEMEVEITADEGRLGEAPPQGLGRGKMTPLVRRLEDIRVAALPRGGDYWRGFRDAIMTALGEVQRIDEGEEIKGLRRENEFLNKKIKNAMEALNG